jgi:hypothetical protein
MRTERGLILVGFWFLVFGAVALLVALDTLTRTASQAAPTLRQATAVVAGLGSAACLASAWGLWRRQGWARPAGVAASALLALLHAGVLPALVALDAVVVWFLWRRETAAVLGRATAEPGAGETD